MKKFFKILFIASIVLNLVLIALIVFLWIQASYLMKHRESSDLEFKKNLYDALKTDNAEKLENAKRSLRRDIKDMTESLYGKPEQDVVRDVVVARLKPCLEKEDKRGVYFMFAVSELSFQVNSGGKIQRTLIDKYLLHPKEKKELPDNKTVYVYDCSIDGNESFTKLVFNSDNILKSVEVNNEKTL
jgi:hypothetical protein